MAKQPDTPDAIDLVAAVIAGKLTLQLADEIARALRRLPQSAGLRGLGRYPIDRTGAERQRRHRENVKKGRVP